MFTDEHDIERALSAALAVQPSEGFERRLLESAAEEGRTRPLCGPWLAAAAAVLAAGLWVLGGGTTQPLQERAVSRVDPPAVVEPGMPSLEPRASLRGEPVRPAAGSREIRAPRLAGVTSTTSEPEVLVPANQLALIDRFVREINGGRVEPPAEVDVAERLRLLTVPEMTVQPIAIATVEAGEPGPGSKGLQQ